MQPARHGRLPGADPQAGTRGIPLPAATTAARARWAGRVDHHVPDLPGEPRRAHLDAPVDHDAAADAGSEGDHHHMAEPAGRAQPVLGQHGQVGVVVHQHDPAVQPLRQQRGPVDALALGQVRCEDEPTLPVDHAGHAHTHRGTPGSVDTPPLGPEPCAWPNASSWSRLTTVATASATWPAAEPRSSAGGVRTLVSATTSSAAPNATPRTLVPPMSTPYATPPRGPARVVTTSTRPAPSALAWRSP